MAAARRLGRTAWVGGFHIFVSILSSHGWIMQILGLFATNSRTQCSQRELRAMAKGHGGWAQSACETVAI